MRLLLSLLFAGMLCACSSVSVREMREQPALAPASAPRVVWVRPFDFPRGIEFDAAATPGEADARARVGRLVADGVLSRSERWVAPGRMLSAAEPPPSAGLLVEGRVLRVRQGSRLLRVGIGFGAGGTRMETSVRVYNLGLSATEPWLRFETTGGSGAEPGLVGMLVPSPLSIPAAASVIGGVVTAGALGTKGVTQDAQRTGRTIAAAVHDRLAGRGVVARKARAKKTGAVPTPVGVLDLPVVD
jgi:hypothetical protein